MVAAVDRMSAKCLAEPAQQRLAPAPVVPLAFRAVPSYSTARGNSV
jgi:hypothetical protein